ncbi:hypothetical protein LCGC14_0146500 [marine sediment metagenome]|uniref:HTH cro/C1-type domain-containing protein n=1 Tax=marine sediment metagenome TaxID=412755 RepID=A0A0F9V3H3_9ZZZZ
MADEEFRLKISLRNNRLIELREDLGLNQVEMAEMIGINGATLNGYECLRDKPSYSAKGIINPVAKKIADFHGVSADWIWPNVVMQIQKNLVEKAIRGDQLQQIAAISEHEFKRLTESPESNIKSDKLPKKIRVTIHTLTKLEQFVINSRMGIDCKQLTLSEIGKKVLLSPERVRQIEAKALRKLRHPTRAKTLKKFVD